MDEPVTHSNPILCGDYPDPSIVRVGTDYYLVNSTFQWFPGIAVSHSRDLVNWQPVGHVLTRESQLNLSHVADSAGIWAPDISFYNDRFWVSYTLQTPEAGLNCIVHSDKPEGPYSDPCVLNNSNIDPSVFSDDDGKRYFVTSRGHVQEMDADGARLLGEPKVVWPGTGGHCPEGPHIIKRHGYYYFMMAEGGTGYEHNEVLARSRSIWGPYESCPHNPVLGPAGMSHPIQKTGHGKPVGTQQGEWWFVYLCGRPYGGKHCNLGRETCLSRLLWTDDDWFTIEEPQLEQVRPRLPWSPVLPASGNEFASEQAMKQWQFVRNPQQDSFSLSDGVLSLNAAVMGRRQEHFNFRAVVQIAPESVAESKPAGLVVYSDSQNYANIRIGPSGATVSVLEKGRLSQYAQSAGAGSTWLSVSARGQSHKFQVSVDGRSWIDAGPTIDGRFLSPESIRLQPGRKSFTGVRIGVFDESAPGDPTRFLSFTYERLTK